MNYEVIIPKPVQKQLKSFPDDVQTRAWTQMLFLLTGDIRLEGATPLEKLQKGEIEPVVLAAKCYGSHSAA